MRLVLALLLIVSTAWCPRDTNVAFRYRYVDDPSSIVRDSCIDLTKEKQKRHDLIKMMGLPRR